MTDALNNMFQAGINYKHTTTPTQPRQVKLGDGSYTGNIIDASNPLAGAVYWHELTDDGTQTVREQGFALLPDGLSHLYANDPSLDGTNIWIHKPALSDPNADKYHVKVTDAAGSAQQFGSTPLAAQKLNAAGQPALAQVSTLSATLNSDLTVTVGNQNEIYSYPAAITLAETQFTQDVFDCTSLIGALTSGQHQAALICLNKATKTLAALITTATAASGALPSRNDLGATDFATFDLLNNPAYEPIIIVYLYFGQTGFVSADRIGPEVRTAFPPAKAYLALKDKWNASAAPTTSNDTTQGYSVGSRWYDTTNRKEYVCMDATASAAVWVGAGSGSNVSGPVSSTDRAIATWNGTAGTVLRNNALVSIDSGGRLITGTGRNVKVRVVTAAGAVAITSADEIVVVNKSVGAATTVNLPSSPIAGDVYCIKDGKGDAATNNLTLTPASGNIDGSATFAININYGGVFIAYDGSQWRVTTYFSSGGGGTVTSVGLSTNASYLTVGSSPVTTNGTIALNKTTGLTANQVVATPNGATGSADLRALVAADIPSLDASKITSGTLALTRGGTNADLSASGPGALWQITNGGNVQDIEPQIIRIKNASGSTANANDCGLLDYDATYGYSYKTTTTANNYGTWCVVMVGAANGSDIWVARRGIVTVKLNANCSIGNYLTTSTTAGQAAVNTSMRPEVFAVALSANAGGAGGTCTAQLLCMTARRFFIDTNDTLRIDNLSSTNFVATINGAPSGTSVVYNAPSSGSDNTLKYSGVSTTDGRIVLYNTTRGTSALIASINTGTRTITLTTTFPVGWASGDTITAQSQTATGAVETGIYFYDLDLANLNLPSTTRGCDWSFLVSETTSVTGVWYYMIHAYSAVTYAFAEGDLVSSLSTTGTFSGKSGYMPVINNRICFVVHAGGAGTASIILRVRSADVAAP